MSGQKHKQKLKLLTEEQEQWCLEEFKTARRTQPMIADELKVSKWTVMRAIQRQMQKEQKRE